MTQSFHVEVYRLADVVNMLVERQLTVNYEVKTVNLLKQCTLCTAVTMNVVYKVVC